MSCGTFINKWFRPAIAAAITVLCGLALWSIPLGERWVNASYDYLFRFGSRAITNNVVVIAMDNRAHKELHQDRSIFWDRRLHTRLLHRLAPDQPALVVFDVFFGITNDVAVDSALADAMRSVGRVVLMAKQSDTAAGKPIDVAEPVYPAELFLHAATNWGVAYLDPNADLDYIVRRHWPFPAPAHYPSLPWTAAQLSGATLSDQPQEQWLRYYSQRGPWTTISYDLASVQPADFFRGKVVFIGSHPHTTLPGDEKDEFRTPYTRWLGTSSAGVDILVTEYLNLLNGEWLRRAPGWIELLVLVVTGAFFGLGLSRLQWRWGCAVAAFSAGAVLAGSVLLSYFTNYWFPWLVIAAGQIPCALAFGFSIPKLRLRVLAPDETLLVVSAGDLPVTPDYELFEPAFAEGAYGKVWLARNAIGQWQALKAVYLSKFASADPYEREFSGIKRYKPISDKHPGLLCVDFISRKKPEGYFYYVMELADSLTPGWEENPTLYQPRDLASVRAQAEGHRISAGDCVHMALHLAEALEFLHRQGLTHRDIKPSNILFVSGRPKLGDVGLVASVAPPDKESTWVGTVGYMPPPPEPPGTVQADIYGLGMVLYVISTGNPPGTFPELSATLLGGPAHEDFLRLNAVILKACHPDRGQRYASAAELRQALMEVRDALRAAGQEMPAAVPQAGRGSAG